MKDRLWVGLLIMVVAICEIIDMVSKIIHDCFWRKNKV